MVRAFAHLGVQLIHLAYLDEFGHVGPYVSRSDRRHNDSPVFGFAGFVMPVSEVRAFGTWFFQRRYSSLASANVSASPLPWRGSKPPLASARLAVARHRASLSGTAREAPDFGRVACR